MDVSEKKISAPSCFTAQFSAHYLIVFGINGMSKRKTVCYTTFVLGNNAVAFWRHKYLQ